MDEDFLDAVQKKKLRPQRHFPEKKISLERNEAANLLDGCQTVMETFIIALLQETGIRNSEACALKWEDIDYKERLIHIRNGKGGKYRAVIITPALEAPMKAYYHSLPKKQRKGHIFRQQSGKPIDRHGLYSRVKRIGKRVGISKVFPHLMRSFCATELLNTHNVAPSLVQDLLGHASIQTTMRYNRSNLNYLKAAMRNLK